MSERLVQLLKSMRSGCGPDDGQVNTYEVDEALELAIQAQGCRCGAMLQQPSLRCPMHPTVRVKTQEEKAQHAKDWDARVEADRAKV